MVPISTPFYFCKMVNWYRYRCNVGPISNPLGDETKEAGALWGAPTLPLLHTILHHFISILHHFIFMKFSGKVTGEKGTRKFKSACLFFCVASFVGSPVLGFPFVLLPPSYLGVLDLTGRVTPGDQGRRRFIVTVR